MFIEKMRCSVNYYQVLSRWPGLVLGVVIVVSASCGIGMFFNIKYLIESDPTRGIWARKTDLSSKSVSYRNLVASEKLSLVPHHRDTFHDNSSFIPLTVKSRNDCDVSNWQQMFKVIIEPVQSNASLLSLPHVRSLCQLQNKLSSHQNVDKSCGTLSILDVLYNVTGVHCDHIKEEDLTNFTNAMHDCLPFYTSGDVPCMSTHCPAIPQVCYILYNVFHYFSDETIFLNVANSIILKMTIIMVSLKDSPSSEIALKYFNDKLATNDYDDGFTRILAIDVDIKLKAYLYYVLVDWKYMFLAFILIAIVMSLYMKSFVMFIVAAVDIGLSMVMAYFLYVVVLNIHFFPFLNLLATMMLIALVADDILLFYDTWNMVRQEFPDKDREEHLRMTFSHAGLSIFATSLTTACSFFSNAVSNIPSLKCFGIYAGLCITANYILICTMIPAIIVILDNFTKSHSCRTPNFIADTSKCIARGFDCLYAKAVSGLIDKAYPVLLIFFLALGIGSALVVFYKPKLTIAQDGTFQALPRSHPIEKYDKYIKSFQFVHDNANLPFIYVWGVVPVDNGNTLDPNDNGTLVIDENCDLLNFANQKFMSDFCEQLLALDFIVETEDATCSLTAFLNEVQSPCIAINQTCCGFNNTYSEGYRNCYATFISNSNRTSIIDMPYFDNLGNVKAYVITLATNWSALTNNNGFKEFVEYTTHVSERLNEKAPAGVACNGFMTSYLYFYDTQNAFASGVFQSSGISMAVALSCVLLTTRNLLLAFYSVFNIVQATLAIVACLVLLGWNLNIVESLIISLAVGLTLDIVIHFGVAYVLSEQATREGKVKDILIKVGSAATMAAFTTFLAGTPMLLSTVSSFQQFGVFLMLCMVFSLAYALFFFLPLCRWLGPLGKTMQIPSLSTLCKHLSAHKSKPPGNATHHTDNNQITDHNFSFGNIDSSLTSPVNSMHFRKAPPVVRISTVTNGTM